MEYVRVFAVSAVGGTTVSTSTSSSGEYRLEGLSAGTYFVYTLGRDGHRGDLYHAMACPGGPPSGCTVSDGTPVVVGATGLTSGIDFSLDRCGMISGSVEDAVTGESLYCELEAYRVGSWQLVKTTHSSGYQAGHYEFNGLEPGDYQVVLELLQDGTPIAAVGELVTLP